ncbi:hypothetical protein DSO57_1005032 [Entomophthora muscae]|uniref:Uncharacterized protein n=1 Tax=Entomophthora muscae TaxID=34485 RepID=A0ACC2UHW7_9FUNG|nr:hypothetical protein DSO57_1005032 [Entomophthora muscae]
MALVGMVVRKWSMGRPELSLVTGCASSTGGFRIQQRLDIDPRMMMLGDEVDKVVQLLGAGGIADTEAMLDKGMLLECG